MHPVGARVHERDHGGVSYLRHSGLDVGDSYACGIRASDGLTECWGRNDYYGKASPPEGVYFSSVSVGDTHACGVRKGDGIVVCWGEQIRNL